MPKQRGTATRKAKPNKRSARTAAKKKWSQAVTRRSSALDLEASVFSKDDPSAIAASLKRSAERSRRRKSEPYRSAMSMLTFYINRAGKQLPQKRRRVLERAKVALREAFGRA
jgi:uncharacterized protein DUF3175